MASVQEQSFEARSRCGDWQGALLMIPEDEAAAVLGKAGKRPKLWL